MIYLFPVGHPVCRLSRHHPRVPAQLEPLLPQKRRHRECRRRVHRVVLSLRQELVSVELLVQVVVATSDVGDEAAAGVGQKHFEGVGSEIAARVQPDDPKGRLWGSLEVLREEPRQVSPGVDELCDRLDGASLLLEWVHVVGLGVVLGALPRAVLFLLVLLLLPLL